MVRTSEEAIVYTAYDGFSGSKTKSTNDDEVVKKKTYADR